MSPPDLLNPSACRVLHVDTNEHGYPPEKVLMVGDSLLDLEGAREAGTGFLGRLTPPGNIFPAEVPILPNLAGLRAFIHGN